MQESLEDIELGNLIFAYITFNKNCNKWFGDKDIIEGKLLISVTSTFNL